MAGAWDPQKHPRAPKGSAGGGKFTSGGGAATSGGSGDAEINAIIAGARAGEKGSGGGRGHSGKGGRGHRTVPTAGLSFNPRTGVGTGYGQRGGDPRVRSLQAELNRLGITDAKGAQLIVDGKYGPLTTSAVKKLQARLGMKQTGKVTPAMLARLSKMQKLPAPSKTRQTRVRTRAPRTPHQSNRPRRAHAALGLNSPAVLRWLEGSSAYA